MIGKVKWCGDCPIVYRPETGGKIAIRCSRSTFVPEEGDADSRWIPGAECPHNEVLLLRSKVADLEDEILEYTDELEEIGLIGGFW